MKKICIIATVAEFLKSYMLLDIQELAKEFEVTMITDDIDQFADGFFDIGSVHSISIQRNIHLIDDVQTLYQLWSHFKKCHYDIVLTVTPKAGLLGMLASFLVKVPIRVHYFTGQVWSNKKGFLLFMLKNIDRFIVFLSTRQMVAGYSQYQFLSEQNIIKKRNSTVMIHSLNTKKFMLNKVLRQQLREQYNLTENTIVFMFLGRVHQEKGILELIQVMQQLLHQHSNIACFIVGRDEGGLTQQLQQFSQLQKAFVLHRTAHPEDILNVADVLLLPSHREGLGFVVYEAALKKIPAIISDHFGMKDVLIHEQTGLVHRQQDIEDMLKQYLALIKEPDLIKKLGAKAYDRAIDEFGDNKKAIQFASYIKSLL